MLFLREESGASRRWLSLGTWQGREILDRLRVQVKLRLLAVGL